MYLIDRIRSERTRAEMESIKEAGNLKIELERNHVTITQRNGTDIRLTYGDLIELYKMLQDLYKGEKE